MVVKYRRIHKYPICKICGCDTNQTLEKHSEHLERHGKYINPNSGSMVSYYFTRVLHY